MKEIDQFSDKVPAVVLRIGPRDPLENGELIFHAIVTSRVPTGSYLDCDEFFCCPAVPDAQSAAVHWLIAR